MSTSINGKTFEDGHSPEALAAAREEMARKKKFSFQVMGGYHTAVGIAVDDHDREYVADIKYGPNRPAGDIVESDVDLAKRFNRPNSIKFKRLGLDGNPLAGELQDQKLRATNAVNLYRRAIEAMNQRALLDHAEKEKIDVKGETKKEELVKIILAAAAEAI